MMILKDMRVQPDRRIIKYAVIGAGVAGSSHCVAISKDPGSELVAIIDTDTQKATALAAKLSNNDSIAVISHIDELDLESVDALVIATPHNSHNEIIKAMVPSGKHILIEKPVVLNESDLKNFERSRKGQIIAVAHQMRNRLMLQELKRLLASGMLGSILTAHVELSCSRNEDYFMKSGWRGKWITEGGSVALNSGIHLIDAALWLTGSYPERVFGAWSSHMPGIETEDRLAGIMITHDDIYITTTMTSQSAERFRPRISLVTTTSTLLLELSFNQDLIDFTGPKDAEDRLRNAIKLDRRIRQEHDGHPGELTHLELIKEFSHACLEGAIGLNLVTPHEGFNSVRVIQALYKSGSTGLAVMP